MTRLFYLKHIQHLLYMICTCTPKHSHITRTLKHSHITPELKSLYWLKIEQRIQYKIISITHNLLHSSEPQYLRNLIKVKPSGKTRSSEYLCLSLPPLTSKLKFSNRASTSLHPTFGTPYPLPQNLCTCQRRSHYKYNKYHQFISFTYF